MSQRQSDAWYRPPRRPERNDALTPGVSYGIRLVGGGVHVVRVLNITPPFVTLRAWGTVEPLEIFLADVESWAVVGAHSYRQAVEVKRRQRAGLPAA